MQPSQLMSSAKDVEVKVALFLLESLNCLHEWLLSQLDNTEAGSVSLPGRAVKIKLMVYRLCFELSRTWRFSGGICLILLTRSRSTGLDSKR